MAKTPPLDPDTVTAGAEVEDLGDKPIILTRAQIREAMFAHENAKPKRIPITMLGQSLEWLQPSIREVSEAQRDPDKHFMVQMLIGYTYVPGSDEKVFVEDDYAVLVGMPMTGEFQEAVRVIGEALDLKVEAKAKN